MIDKNASPQRYVNTDNNEKTDNEVFIARQPILNRVKKTFGYELLFRRSHIQAANVTDNVKATASVMVNALNNIGMTKLIGDKRGFINVDEQVLASGITDLLPNKVTVFELLETVVITEAVLSLCRNARKGGYQLALDDYIPANGNAEILSLANYVKIDVMATERDEIVTLSKELKKYPSLKLVAEKVETQEDFQFCFDLDFDYFQGYFFSKPSIISAKTISPTQIVLLELSRMLAREEEFYLIEKLFRQNPELHIKLLQFINSAAFYTAQKITSIGQSIALLGYRNLQKWVTLLLFAGEGYDMKSTPLFERAVLRGRIMELLTSKVTKSASTADTAFITGVLSLIDTLFQSPLENILKEFNLSEEINNALLHRDGLLGTLVSVMEDLEEEKYDELKSYLETLNIDIDELFKIESNAIVEFENMNG